MLPKLLKLPLDCRRSKHRVACRAAAALVVAAYSPVPVQSGSLRWAHGISNTHPFSGRPVFQSSTVALLAARGKIEPLPRFSRSLRNTRLGAGRCVRAISTGWSANCEGRLRFVRVSAGNIRDDALATGPRGESSKPQGICFLSRSCCPEQGRRGLSGRQCTTEYKVRPHSAGNYVVAVFGARNQVSMWRGISLDEVQRMKPADVQYIDHRWPLGRDADDPKRLP